jgi:site-specific DNA-methyltransferase (adenine-specific)
MQYNTILHGDCLNLLSSISDESVDLILCDLPYGATRNKWDTVIPLKEIWEHYRRIIKKRGVIALTGQGLFTAKLIMSAPDIFRYTLIWKKNKPRGFLNANRQPLRIHEDIAIFYKAQPKYYPQKTSGHPPVHSFTKHSDNSSNYGKTKDKFSGGGSTQRFPTSIIPIPVVNEIQTLHPTQKPVALGEWLIKTYTDKNDIVLDNACGSGSFLVAAKNLDRRYIGIELDKDYFEIAEKRLS